MQPVSLMEALLQKSGLFGISCKKIPVQKIVDIFAVSQPVIVDKALFILLFGVFFGTVFGHYVGGGHAYAAGFGFLYDFRGGGDQIVDIGADFTVFVLFRDEREVVCADGQDQAGNVLLMQHVPVESVQPPFSEKGIKETGPPVNEAVAGDTGIEQQI